MLGKRLNGKGKVAIVAGGIAAVMMISGVSAFFTANSAKTNTWTVGSVTISLEETEYDKASDERENITPDQKLTKDPVIKNTGANDAFVFMKVSVPKASVKVASEDGSQVTEGVQELFKYTIDPAWTIIDTKENIDNNTYVFAYGSSSEMSALSPEGSTPVLFKGSNIIFKNVIEGQGLENKTLEMPVEAFAIQTTNLGNGATDPASVWNILNNQANAS